MEGSEGGEVKLKLQRLYNGGWMTVAMVDSIGEVDWLFVFHNKHFRIIDQQTGEVLNHEPEVSK
jgi:hypothetical protein